MLELEQMIHSNTHAHAAYHILLHNNKSETNETSSLAIPTKRILSVDLIFFSSSLNVF